MSNTQNHNGTALITGASEGIGWEMAKIMAADGWNLMLTARRETLLQNLADDLTKQFNIEAYVYAADLSHPDGANNVFGRSHTLGLTIDALINNAGFGIKGSIKDNDPDRVRQLLQLNIISLTNLTRLFLPDMIMRGQGRIMNVGSIAGLQPMPMFAVYSSSKAYVRSFTEALAVETEGTGVTVTLLAPGRTKTGFSRVAGYSKSSSKVPLRMKADHVAQLGYRAMMAGKPTIITGMMNKVIALISTSMPRRTVAKMTLKAMSKRVP